MGSSWLAAIGLSCLLGCFTAPPRPPDPMRFADDSIAMRREVLKHVPFGMPLKQARAIMEANGFTCANNRRSRVMVCDANPNSRPVRVWLYYDPEDTIKEVQARCDFHAPRNEE